MRGTDKVHRIAVIDFATGVEVTMNEKLSFDGFSAMGVSGIERLLEEKIHDRGDTSFKGKLTNWDNWNSPNSRDKAAYTATDQAFARAANIFDQWKTEPKGASTRSRHLVLITDGRPTSPGNTGPKPLQDKIEKTVKKLRDGFKPFDMDVLGIDENGEYWNEDEKFWVDVTGGRAQRAVKPINVAQWVKEIGDRWLGVKGNRILGDTYEAPPYLRRLEFEVYTASVSPPLRLLSPTGVEIFPVTATGGSPKAFTFFSIDNPEAGIYRFGKPDGFVGDISANALGPRVVLREPVRQVDVSESSSIIYQALLSRDTDILKERSGAPLTAEVAITGPDCKPACTLKAEIGDDGRCTTKERWQPPAKGEYQIQLTLKRSKDGQVVAVSPGETITATDNPVLRLNLLEPSGLADVGLPPWRGSLHVGLQLHGKKGEKVDDPKSFIPEPDSWLSVRRVDAAGAPLAGAAGEPLPIHRDKGVFSFEVPVDVGFVDGIGWGDPVRVDLVLSAGDVAKGAPPLAGVRLPDGDETHRVLSDPMSIGRIQVRWPWWLRWLTLIVGGLLVLGVTGVLAFLMLPRLIMGALDRSLGGRLEFRVFDANRDPNAIQGANPFPLGGRLRLNLDGKVEIGPAGSKKIFEHLRLRRTPANHAKLRVAYRLAGEKNIREDNLPIGVDINITGAPSGTWRMRLMVNKRA
ncbi:MAG: hypothetical protein H7840_08440 [Alphaproteobacteria bacterium]